MNIDDNGNKLPDEYWWKVKKNPHNEVFGTVEFLLQNQQHHRNAFSHFLRLYSNRLATGYLGQDFITSFDDGSKIKINVVKSCIDTAVAQIAAERSRPMHLSRGGSYKLRKKVERLDQFIIGNFMREQHYIKALDVFRDSALFGPGWEHIHHFEDNIYLTRVPAAEMLVDDNDAKYGTPRQLFRVVDADRDQLIELYGNKNEIEDATNIKEEDETSQSIVNPCTAIEAWHLPSGPNAKDGRHIICVSNKTLLDEEWNDPFPFGLHVWNPAPYGILGIGAAEELASIQIEINYIAQKIQKLMTLATSMVWTEKGSSVAPVNNMDWAQREYRGKPPIFQTTAAVSAEYFSHFDRLYQRAYEIVGISQLQAQGVKPAGLDSGEALRVHHDIASRRFKHTGQRWAQFHCDVGERIVEAARRAKNDGYDIEVLSPGDRVAKSVKFSDVDVDRKDYCVRVHPVSLLPDEPAGKIQRLQELAQAVPELAPYLPALLSGVPDLESAVQTMTAPLEMAQQQIENILDGMAYEMPTPHMNLQLTRDMAVKNLLRAQIDGISEERQEVLRQYIDNIDTLTSMAAPPAPPPMVPGTIPEAPMGGQPPPGPPGLPTPNPGQY